MNTYFLFMKNNIKIIMEYKSSFLIQAFAMLISNTSFFLIWYFVFKRFWSFSWFGFNDYLIMFDTLLFNFCFVHILAWWYGNIATWASNWTLDNFLLMPWHLLTKILPYWIPNSIFWDLINAVIMPFFIPWFTLIMFFKVLYFSFIWWFVFLWFLLISLSLSFFIWSSKELSRSLFELILWPWNYPQKIFEWTMFKLLFITIVPVYYTFYLPFNLVRQFEWNWFIILHISALLFMWVWIYIFNKWLKRYESWNQIITNS